MVQCRDGRGRALRRRASAPIRSPCPRVREPEQSRPVPTLPEHPNTTPTEPSRPQYSARVAMSCDRDHAPEQVLYTSQELRSIIDDRLRRELGDRYDRHRTECGGTDKLTITFTLRAPTHADAIRSAGMAAGTVAELLTDNAVGVDLSGVALVVRAIARRTSTTRHPVACR